ncbi:MAG: pimeloyl-ACP methyl ester esterase BioH [Thioalkalivibrio sp.]
MKQQSVAADAGNAPLPTFLCIHGWGLNGSVWQDLGAALAGHARVLAPDLPGHGALGDEAVFGGLDRAADRLAGDLDGPVMVVGWSLGGLVALTLARRHPQKVKQVMLLASTPRFVRAPDWPHAMDPDVLATFARDLGADYQATLGRFLALQLLDAPGRAEALRRLKARCLAAPPSAGALAEGLEILWDTDLREQLRVSDVPVRAVLGDLDRLVPAELARDLAALRPGMPVDILRGAGHAPLLTHGPQIARLLLGEAHVG